MAKLARDVMTPDPTCCTPTTTLDQVAKLMAQNDCGEIPVVDTADQLIGVITDRDIVCRVVAEGKNPISDQRPRNSALRAADIRLNNHGRPVTG